MGHVVVNPLHLHSFLTVDFVADKYSLKSVLGLAGCFEGVFLHKGKNPTTINFRCLLQASRPFGGAELI